MGMSWLDSPWQQSYRLLCLQSGMLKSSEGLLVFHVMSAHETQHASLDLYHASDIYTSLLMIGDYTQESSYYDVIRYDIMANNEHLMPIDCLSASCDNSPVSRKYAWACHYRLYLLPNYKLVSTFPAIVRPKLTRQWEFQIQVVKYFMFFAAYVQ